MTGENSNINNNNEIISEDHESLQLAEKRKEYENYKKHIYEFKNKYMALQGREPFDTEITDNLKEIIPINIIEQIIRENNV